MSMSSNPTPAEPRHRWWNPFARMEEVAFVRTPEGWLFQAPSLWLIGPRRCYLLNDAQKMQVAALLRRMWNWAVVAIAAVVAASIPLVSALVSMQGALVMVAAWLVLGAAAGLLLSGITRYRLRPILAGIAPSARRIRQIDVWRNQVRVFSRGRIAFFGLLSIVMLALQLANAMTSAKGWTAINILGTGLFSLAALYWAILFFAKARMERTAG